MKKVLISVLVLFLLQLVVVNSATAQKKKKKPATTRTGTKRKKNVSTNGRANVRSNNPGAETDPVASAAAPAAPAADSLPIPVVKTSKRIDAAVWYEDDPNNLGRSKTPLPYEHLRADDAMFRHRLWRILDTREKLNMPFRYNANENSGNQQFISILLKAVQDEAVTVFDGADDRFTTPMTKGDVAKSIVGDPIQVPVYDSTGTNILEYKTVSRDIVLDSFYRYSIKEEVIFDKESSRLFWRIIGIAPIYSIYTAQTNQFIGDKELFWVYYPDLRPWLARYEIYNGKNFGQRQSWEELFESRMFSARIVKSTIDNPYNRYLDQIPGLKDYPILQLLEGEGIKEKIFNYEQDLWSY
jgi:gliding motility associated protien GldN